MEGDDLADDYSPYAVKNDYCVEGSPGIQVASIIMDDMLPLAGMHGRANVNGPGLESFAWIWFDEEKDKCMRQSMSRSISREIMTAEQAEGMITESMARENSYVEDMLVEFDLGYVNDDILERMVLGDLNID